MINILVCPRYTNEILTVTQARTDGKRGLGPHGKPTFNASLALSLEGQPLTRALNQASPKGHVIYSINVRGFLSDGTLC